MESSNYNINDISFLRTDYSPEVTESFFDISPPEIISKYQKSIQRYVNILLTNIGTVKMSPYNGTDLMYHISKGNISNEESLAHVFMVASEDTLNMIRADDSREIYGNSEDSPYDIESVDLVEVSVDNNTGSVYVDAIINFLDEEVTGISIPVR